MSRKLFLTVAGVLACFFGLGMLAAPQQMLSNMARDAREAELVLQWMGVVLFSVGIVNLLSRDDPESRGAVVHGVLTAGFAYYLSKS